MNEALVKFEGLPLEMNYPDHVTAQLLRVLRCSPERWEELLRCTDKVNTISTCYRTIEERCKQLEGHCDLLMRLVRHVCCTANVNFSKITIDEVSDDSQVALDEPVPGLGGDFVNNFPVPPGKKIRLQHGTRPGWTPSEIRIDMNLAGGASNYLDFSVQLYLGPGDTQLGKPIGPNYSGNSFLNKDGSQIRVPFPRYKNEPIDVGSLERLAVVISNRSAATNLDSVQVILAYDNNRFYEMCRSDACKPGC